MAQPGQANTSATNSAANLPNNASEAPPPAADTFSTTPVGDFPKRKIEEEMQTSYLDYAMSVIVARALPDVRDGLKPVHRRILFVMNEMGLRPGAKFKKSANVVGEVLGKYHPHGDSSVYEAMVRMAQDFSLRYPLVHGQGNFGSIDGDSAAAYRYTEAKMQKISEELLADLEKATVDFSDNYDGSRQEPTVLPTRLPNLLLNGTVGIAVGMATNIPPHNLGELSEALIYLLQNPECQVSDLLKIIRGPDFPTGGIIYDKKKIREVYETGRGSIPVRGKAEITEGRAGKPVIIINEIPFQVNKANLVSKIADLVKNKKITGITDIRDESTQHALRIVVELRKDSYPNKILNQLYKLTELQNNFNVNLIALVERGLQPHLLNLKQALGHFLTHRQEVVTRRAKFELEKARARAHILEGLKRALDQIDAVITMIRQAKTKEDAQVALKQKFDFTEVQAKAILEMRLQALAGLERKKVEEELKEKKALIKELEALLASPQKILGVIQEELQEIKTKYADARKTKVVARAVGEFSARDTIPNEEMIVMLTTENYVKRVAPSSFRPQKRGGKGVIGLTTKEADEIKIVRHACNHDDVMFFTNTGRVFRLPVYEIPAASRQAKGTAIVNLIQIKSNEVITAMRITSEDSTKTGFLFFCTKKGIVKKVPMEDFANVRKSGLVALKLKERDELNWIKGSSGENEIVIISHGGKCCRFPESEVRSMGRNAAGVHGIKLEGPDFVVEMDVVKNPKGERLLTVTEKGLGKASLVADYRITHRGASGVKTIQVTPKTGKVVGAKVLTQDPEMDLILISKRGQTIRIPIQGLPTRGRNTQGVILMRVKNDSVASISLLKRIPEEIKAAMKQVLSEPLEKAQAQESPESAAAATEAAANKAELEELKKRAVRDQKEQKE